MLHSFSAGSRRLWERVQRFLPGVIAPADDLGAAITDADNDVLLVELENIKLLFHWLASTRNSLGMDTGCSDAVARTETLSVQMSCRSLVPERSKEKLQRESRWSLQAKAYGR
jgi:hypothetical protein